MNIFSFQKIMDLFALGGPMSIPLLIASITSLAVIIEKIIFFAKHKDNGFRNLNQLCSSTFRNYYNESNYSY